MVAWIFAGISELDINSERERALSHCFCFVEGVERFEGIYITKMMRAERSGLLSLVR